MGRVPNGDRSMKDLFLRRIYTYNGISIAVDIDLVKKQVSLVEKKGNGTFQNKKWLFAERELKYMDGWLAILSAMQYAIKEASKILEEAEKRDQDEFLNLMIALDDNLDNKKGKK